MPGGGREPVSGADGGPGAWISAGIIFWGNGAAARQQPGALKAQMEAAGVEGTIQLPTRKDCHQGKSKMNEAGVFDDVRCCHMAPFATQKPGASISVGREQPRFTVRQPAT